MGNSHKNHLVAQLEPNFDGIVIGWSSSKIVSGSHALPPRKEEKKELNTMEKNYN
jgi:hypothetical protein